MKKREISDSIRYSKYEPLDTRSNKGHYMDSVDVHKCVDCGSKEFETNSDDSISCLDCGLVRNELVLDHRPTVNYNDDGVSNEQHGRPQNEFEHESLTTEISPLTKAVMVKVFLQKKNKSGVAFVIWITGVAFVMVKNEIWLLH